MTKYQSFSATYTDLEKFDRKPNEDYILVSNQNSVFVVADGVTNSHFPSGEYSFPSGAKAAAEIFCYSSLEFLEKKLSDKLSLSSASGGKIMELIKGAFDFANQRIYQLNKNEGISEKLDYYIYDFFDTVAVLSIILNDTLYYGYVGDCGLAVFDSENQLKFQTEDGVIKAAQYLHQLSRKNHWSKKEREIFWRRNLRNHLSGKYYGTFDGENGVKKYYRIGEKKLRKGDLVVLYSDGFFEYLKSPKFIRILRAKNKKLLDSFTRLKAMTNLKKYGTDRSLIAIDI